MINVLFNVDNLVWKSQMQARKFKHIWMIGTAGKSLEKISSIVCLTFGKHVLVIDIAKDTISLVCRWQVLHYHYFDVKNTLLAAQTERNISSPGLFNVQYVVMWLGSIQRIICGNSWCSTRFLYDAVLRFRLFRGAQITAFAYGIALVIRRAGENIQSSR